MRRAFGLILSTAIVYALLFTSTAYAGPTWCEEDPVFVVNGLVVDITTGFELKDLPYARSAAFELQVPSNATAAVVTIPSLIPTTGMVSKVLPAYSGEGPIAVVALVTLKGLASFPIRTRIAGTYGELVSWKSGGSNKTQKISFGLSLP